jgi:hypothetical protein
MGKCCECQTIRDDTVTVCNPCIDKRDDTIFALTKERDEAVAAKRHMDFCRALAKTPDDEVLADFIERLTAERDEAVEQRDKEILAATRWHNLSDKRQERIAALKGALTNIGRIAACEPEQCFGIREIAQRAKAALAGGQALHIPQDNHNTDAEAWTHLPQEPSALTGGKGEPFPPMGTTTVPRDDGSDGSEDVPEIGIGSCAIGGHKRAGGKE